MNEHLGTLPQLHLVKFAKTSALNLQARNMGTTCERLGHTNSVSTQGNQWHGIVLVPRRVFRSQRARNKVKKNRRNIRQDSSNLTPSGYLIYPQHGPLDNCCSSSSTDTSNVQCHCSHMMPTQHISSALPHRQPHSTIYLYTGVCIGRGYLLSPSP